MAKCAACDKEVHESEQYKGWCLACIGELNKKAREAIS